MTHEDRVNRKDSAEEDVKKCYCVSSLDCDPETLKNCFIPAPTARRKTKTATVSKIRLSQTEVVTRLAEANHRKRIVSLKVSKDKHPFKPAPAKTIFPFANRVIISDSNIPEELEKPTTILTEKKLYPEESSKSLKPCWRFLMSVPSCQHISQESRNRNPANQNEYHEDRASSPSEENAVCVRDCGVQCSRANLANSRKKTDPIEIRNELEKVIEMILDFNAQRNVTKHLEERTDKKAAKSTNGQWSVHKLVNQLEPTVDQIQMEAVEKKLTESQMELEQLKNDFITRETIHEEEKKRLQKELRTKADELLASFSRERELKISVSSAQKQIDAMNKSFEGFNDSLKDHTERVKQLQNENQNLRKIASVVNEMAAELQQTKEERDKYRTDLSLTQLDREKMTAYLSIKNQEIEGLKKLLKRMKKEESVPLSENPPTVISIPNGALEMLPVGDTISSSPSPDSGDKYPLMIKPKPKTRKFRNPEAMTLMRPRTPPPPPILEKESFKSDASTHSRTSLYDLKEELKNFFVKMKYEAELLSKEAEHNFSVMKSFTRAAQPEIDLSNESTNMEDECASLIFSTSSLSYS